MDELSRALLHGTAGLDAAEDAMSGNLGAALREQAISEWAGQPEPERPAYRARQSYRAGPAMARSGSSRPPEITRRSQVLAFVVIGLVILILILVAVG
jgi:hypothetical protein